MPPALSRPWSAVLLALLLACGTDPAAPANRAPTAAIAAPLEGSSHPEGVAVAFQGSATDPEEGTLSGAALAWSSDLDGPLGTGEALQVATLSPGMHTVTLRASDSRGASGQAVVHFTVTPASGGNLPPAVQITSPAPGSRFTVGTAVTLDGGATDPEDGPLTGAALVWASSLDGPLGTGAPLTVTALSAGDHLITLTATDGGGASAQATRAITVTAAPVSLVLREVARGLSRPLFLTAPPGDVDRLFVVEKTGTIRVIRRGILLATPFLDLTDSVSTGSEQGLLGMAFAPDYATSGRFIVSYTDRAGDSRVVRYRVMSGDPDRSDPASADSILTVPQPFDNHNGGMVAFGPDGYLYLGLGDGGGGGDPLGTGQDRRDLLGSLLRLDVGGQGPGYAIPPDNPYLSAAGFRPELWNYGLRNPWRFSFDRQTGDLYIADVGQGAREEVNVAPAGSRGGENYGWNIMEGTLCYNATTCNRAGLTLPVLDYTHGEGCSVTGGYVYRGNAIPALRGHYFYSDYCSHWVRSFRWVNGQAADRTDWPSLDPGSNVPSFGEDAAGELYLTTEAGTVYRIEPGP
jgi:glucose/arabinose dehydrogenase